MLAALTGAKRGQREAIVADSGIGATTCGGVLAPTGTKWITGTPTVSIDLHNFGDDNCDSRISELHAHANVRPSLLDHRWNGWVGMLPVGQDMRNSPVTVPDSFGSCHDARCCWRL